TCGESGSSVARIISPIFACGFVASSDGEFERITPSSIGWYRKKKLSAVPQISLPAPLMKRSPSGPSVALPARPTSPMSRCCHGPPSIACCADAIPRVRCSVVRSAIARRECERRQIITAPSLSEDIAASGARKMPDVVCEYRDCITHELTARSAAADRGAVERRCPRRTALVLRAVEEADPTIGRPPISNDSKRAQQAFQAPRYAV